MTNNFVSKVVCTTWVLAFLVYLYMGFRGGFFESLGILLGAFWGMANIYFLKKTLEEWLKMGSRDYLKFFTFLQIKFIVLYAVGYALLSVKIFSPLSLLSGSSLIFLAIFLLGIYQAILDKASQKKGLI